MHGASKSHTLPGDLWFRRRPKVALAVIVAMYVAVLAVRLLAGSAVDAYSMFYVLPVALAAVAFGLRGGIVAAVVAVMLIALWAVIRDVALSPSAWATRVIPIVLLGILLGAATDRAREAELERRLLERATWLQRQAIEINDSLIQRMTAAKWSLEAGQVEASLEVLSTAVADGQRLVSELIRQADMGQRTERVPRLLGDGRAPD